MDRGHLSPKERLPRQEKIKGKEVMSPSQQNKPREVIQACSNADNGKSQKNLESHTIGQPSDQELTALKGEFEEALDSLPNEYKPSARNFADKAFARAREAYKEVLEGYQQGSDKSNARMRFEKACNQIKELPDILKHVYEIETKLNDIKIKLNDINIPLYTRFLDLTRKKREHRPERVKKEFEQFETTFKEMSRMLCESDLPKEMKDKFIKDIDSLTDNFQTYSALAIRGYGDGSKERASRKKGEEKIRLLNYKMSKNLEWLPIDEQGQQFSDTVKNIREKINKKGYLPEKIGIKCKEACIQIHNDFAIFYNSMLQDYKEKLPFKEGDKPVINDLSKIISEMNEDLDRWHRVQKALDNTPEEYRSLVHTLTDQEITLAKEAYEQVLKGYQQGSDQPLAKEHFENTCCWLEERANKITSEMNEDLGRWHRVQKALDNTPEEYRSLVHTLTDQAKEAYKQVLKGYQQGSDQPLAKEHFEKVCRWLDIVSLRVEEVRKKEGKNRTEDHGLW